MAEDLKDLRAKWLQVKAQRGLDEKNGTGETQTPKKAKSTLKLPVKPKNSSSSKVNPVNPVKKQNKLPPIKSLRALSELRAKSAEAKEPEIKKVPSKPKQTVRKDSNAVGSEIIKNQPNKLEVDQSLPVAQKADEIAQAIKDNQVVIVCGETGSGKTTQLPKICLQLGRGQKGLIGHTQPRRIAATSIAKRISEEIGNPLGEVVGYKIRFKDAIDKGASVKLMTDGILLAETQSDPLLRAYDTIIIDEAHERSLNIDFILGYLKQILPRRKDLKVIITSATIDAESFAKHFESVNGKPIPVINVSGRLYPVQIKYSPLDKEDEENDDRTLMLAISDACDELMSHGSGDVLVFLPGEREIREAADFLAGQAKRGVEILPLFSRLTIEEQDRIFHKSGGRRIVLATNIAETSLTVPGIRYVVDTGLARVKRYSYRNKVEQLQVEPVSQAAAKQRAGRCGRVQDGICIRLYSEQDFDSRDQYTDPEILRSSLATVILKMKSLHLSDVREFPFVQPPLPRAIADGYDQLLELNAVTARGGELTQIGRQLSKLPLDVKLARMLLAGSENQALSEVLIIASAISVQDPRERPIDAQQQADAAHKKFADEKSDFIGWLKLWNFVTDAIANKQSNRLLEKQFRENFLSVRRVREWRDVYRQLKEMVQELGWRINTAPATYEQLHKSLMSGLLGNLGNRILDADYKSAPYQGARGIKFWPWPGSALAKKGGKWIMAVELVETTRLFARTIGNIEPEWIEKVGAHLIKKSWSDPHWEKKVAHVVAFEKGTLYGLPIYGQRKVDFSKKDPKLARELFIREALVEGELESTAPFWQHNQALIRDIKEMEHKSRRPDVLVDEESIFQFYDKLIPADVNSLHTLDKWRTEAEKDSPKLLFLKKQDLMRHDASGITIEYFPKKIEVAGIPMALNYNFEPGSPRDGVTLTVPLYALNMLDEKRLEWLVPGMIKEKVHLLVKSLPQRLRRHFVPIPEWAKQFAMEHETPSGDLIETIIDEAKQKFKIDIQRSDFKFEQLPPHLTMNYKVVDEHGRQLQMSRSIPQLRSELGGKARENFQNVVSQDNNVAEDLQSEITDWDFGELPDIMEIKRKGVSFIGHPALVDKGEYCSLEVFDDPDQAAAEHKKGLVRLTRLQLKDQIKYLDKNLRSLQTAQIQAGSLSFLKQSFISFEQLKNDVIDSSIESIIFESELPTNKEQFSDLIQRVKGKLNLLANELARLISTIVSEAALVQQKMHAHKNQKELLADITSQLGELFKKDFVKASSVSILKHYPRYLKAIQVRLDKYRNDPARDAQRMSEVNQLEIKYKKELASRRGVYDSKLAEFGNLLQELRVSLFAQELKTPSPVSVKRLTKLWALISVK